MYGSAYMLKKAMEERGRLVPAPADDSSAESAPPTAPEKTVKILHRTKLVAKLHVMDVLSKQKPNGSWHLAQDVISILALDELMLRNWCTSNVPNIAPSLDPSSIETVGTSIIVKEFVKLIINELENSGPVLTMVEQNIGVIKVFTQEKLSDNSAAGLQSLMARKGYSQWMDRVDEFLATECGVAIDSPAFVEASQSARSFLSTAPTASTVNPHFEPKQAVVQRTRIPSLRGRFMQIQSAAGKGTPPPPPDDPSLLDVDFVLIPVQRASEPPALTWSEQTEAGSWNVRLGTEIGHGSYGVVYESTIGPKNDGDDGAIREQCATKVLPVHEVPDSSQFLAELEILTKLPSHPNVVGLKAASITPPRFAMVMELLPGGSLADLIYSTEPLEWPRVLKFATDMVRGMNFLHSHKPPILHRDLKPQNLLLTADRRTAKIADFSTATFISPSESITSKHPVGTPMYMAKEVFLRMPYHTRCDVYSAGIVMWELTARITPFEKEFRELGATNWDPVLRLIVAERRRPSPWPEWVPEAYRTLTERCWSELASQRPDFNTVLHELEEMGNSIPSNPSTD